MDEGKTHPLHLHFYTSTLKASTFRQVWILEETRCENISYLEHSEAGLLGQPELLGVAGVGVVSVVVEPLLEDLDGLLGEVSAALAAAGRAAALVAQRAPVGVLLRRGVLVRRRAGVALTLANCQEREELIQCTLDIL